MTISSTVRKAGPFAGDDATTVFPFTFKVFADTDLYVVRADTAEEALTLGADYTATLNPDQNVSPGGTVTLAAPLASGSTLTVTSALEYLQQTDLTNGGGFYPSVITDVFDRLAIFAQQLAEDTKRAIRLPLSSTASADLPPPIASRLIGYGSDGELMYYAPFDAGAMPDLDGGTYTPRLAGAVVEGTVKAADVVSKGPVVDVRAFGSAKTHVPILEAIASLDATKGGTIILERGETYTIGQSLMVVDRHNVRIIGNGATLRATATPTPDAALWNDANLGYGGTIVYGIVTLDSTSATIATTPTSNVTIEDVTFDSSSFTEAGNGKTVFVGVASDVTFRNCRFLGNNAETLYQHGHTYLGTNYSAKRLRYVWNYFGPTGTNEQITTNSQYTTGVLVQGNFFDQCGEIGVHLIGDDVAVLGNRFYRVKYRNLQCGEGSTAGKGCIVANNIIEEPGYGATSGAMGIYVVNIDSGARANLVIGNVVRDLVASGGASDAIAFRGNAQIIGNVISGVSGTLANSSAITMYNPNGASGAVTAHIKSNVLEDTGDAWENGITIGNARTDGDQVTVHLSGNYMGSAAAGKYRLMVNDNASGKHPNVYISGDTYNGYIIGRKGQMTGVLNNTGTLNNVPFYGNNVGAPTLYRADAGDESNGISYLVDGSTTPSVAGKRVVRALQTNPTTITNFTGATLGETVTIVFEDSKTTLANGSSLKLAGGVNFTSTANDTITLLQTGSAWVELSRSVN